MLGNFEHVWDGEGNTFSIEFLRNFEHFWAKFEVPGTVLGEEHLVFLSCGPPLTHESKPLQDWKIPQLAAFFWHFEQFWDFFFSSCSLHFRSSSNFEQFWAFLSNFELIWAQQNLIYFEQILNNFEQFRAISSNFEQFWADLCATNWVNRFIYYLKTSTI